MYIEQNPQPSHVSYPQPPNNLEIQHHQNVDILNHNLKNQPKHPRHIINNNLESNLRNGFIRKVYSILLVQLLITFFMALLAAYEPNFRHYLRSQESLPLLITLSLILFSIIIIFFCFFKLLQKFPINYVILGLYTAAQALLVSFASATTSPEIVIMAMSMTVAVALSLTIYAITSKTDFTLKLGSAYLLSAIFLMILIFGFFSVNSIFNIVICALAVLLFGFYLIIDTQLIMGGKKYNLSIDDYIIGALILYIDIIGIFLYLTQLFSIGSNQ